MNDRCSEELKDGGVSFYVGLFTAFSIVVGCFASLVGDTKFLLLLCVLVEGGEQDLCIFRKVTIWTADRFRG